MKIKIAFAVSQFAASKADWGKGDPVNQSRLKTLLCHRCRGRPHKISHALLTLLSFSGQPLENPGHGTFTGHVQPGQEGVETVGINLWACGAHRFD
jgi:hypothetical protein